jgi:hypothetical protein
MFPVKPFIVAAVLCEIHSGLIFISDDTTGHSSYIDSLTPASLIEEKMYELKQWN